MDITFGQALPTFFVFGALIVTTGFHQSVPALIAFILFALVIARPVVVLASFVRTRIPASEKLFMAWFGPKGVASILFALLALKSDAPDAIPIFDIASLTIVGSIAVHGLTDTIGTTWCATAPDLHEICTRKWRSSCGLHRPRRRIRCAVTTRISTNGGVGMTATVSIPGQSADDEDRMSYLGRLRMRMHCNRLDHRLADGEDPAGDPELRRRAAELCARRKRERIAAVLERVSTEAEGPTAPFESKAPLARQAICACPEEIDVVIGRLTDSGSVAPRGLAQVALLIREGSSPLYSPSTSERGLRDRLEEIASALD